MDICTFLGVDLICRRRASTVYASVYFSQMNCLLRGYIFLWVALMCKLLDYPLSNSSESDTRVFM